VGVRRIVVRIDRLVLDGFASAERDDLVSGVRDELSHLLSDPANLRALIDRGHIPSLRVDRNRTERGPDHR
jgi:hypothetical protein